MPVLRARPSRRDSLFGTCGPGLRCLGSRPSLYFTGLLTTLTPGSRLGPYEIISTLGEGGMGEVYRATDTNLKRQVAIKVLPAAMAADADRIARFQREAEVLAALNHPNIAHIHGVEKADGIFALVMELVEGPTLADMLASGSRLQAPGMPPRRDSGSGPEPKAQRPMPDALVHGLSLADALPIAKQIAEALEAAHEHGIIHRDLKPANIKVRDDSMVKVLDFGLAKAMDPAVGSSASVSMSPTITTPAMTQAGMILGTAAYMSPEQARGRSVDKRTDIWAFGCVLFEMLTGQRAFPGEDVTDTLAAVVRAEPDWTRLPASLSPALRTYLQRCLEKDPRQRIHDIADVRLALEGAFETAIPPAAQSSASSRRVSARPVALALVVGAVVSALSMWFWTRPVPPPPAGVERFVIPTPAEAPPTVANINSPALAMSADGSRVVYRTVMGEATTTASVLYLRDRGQLEPTLVRGSEGAIAAFFSPDGEWLGFGTLGDNMLKRVPALGGAPQTICALDGPLRGASWGRDDTIVFATQTSKGLRRVAATGGEPEELTKVDTASGETGHYWPEVLPGGQGVLFTAWNGRPDRSRIAVVSLADGHVSTLVTGGTYSRFAPTGHLFFAIGGTLHAVRFDAARLSLAGTPTQVVAGVSMTVSGAANYAVSSTGSLAYIPGPDASTSTRPMRLAFSDRAGAADLVKAPPGPYELPRLSPDGHHIAFGTNDGQDATIWVYDLSGASAARRLTFGGQGHNRFPVWSADSQRVTFQSDREKDVGIFWQRADGTGPAERLATTEAGTAYTPEAWSPDGMQLLYNATGRDGMTTLWTWSLKERKAARFDAVVNTGTVPGAVFSPDGKWVAYTSEGRSGRDAVYVQPVPPTGAKYQISNDTENGHHPVWSPDGKELFFSFGPLLQLRVVRVVTRPAFSVGEATTFSLGFNMTAPNFERPYDISRDGKRFLGLIDATQTDPSGKPEPPQIRMVLNWSEELKRLVPAR